MKNISIIIPSYHDGTHVLELLPELPSSSEIIIVESGDSSYFSEVLKHFPRVKLFKGVKGRATQMNYGVLQSKGDILLFLHADSLIKELRLEKLLLLPPIVWGCFTVCFTSSHKYLKLVELHSNIRAKYFHTIYGDQGIFVSRRLFYTVGGFDETKPFEDIIMSKSLRNIVKPVILPERICSSPRRFERYGIVRASLLMGLIGFSHNVLGSEKLAVWFYKKIS